MTVDWMRNKLMFGTNKYNSIGWQNKVSKMSDNQVIAVYFKFKKQGLFKKPKKSRGVKLKETYHQVTIFEYLEDKKNEQCT